MVTYREPPSGGSFLNDATTILDETLKIGRCVLRLLLPVVTAAMDTPTKEEGSGGDEDEDKGFSQLPPPPDNPRSYTTYKEGFFEPAFF